MNIELKNAWFTVGLIATTLIVCLVLGTMIGYPPAFGALGLLGFLGLTPLLFRSEGGRFECDERDVAVSKKATLVAGICSYLAVVLGGMVVWLIQYLRGVQLISIHWIPGLVVVAALVLYLARSVFIISQYTPKALGSDE